MLDVKVCCMCKQALSKESFKSKTRSKDGLQSQCISCQKDYRKQHYSLNKEKYKSKSKLITRAFRDWWITYKSSLACTKCGESHIACLDFHHENPLEKDGNVAFLVAHGNKNLLLLEVEKCTVLCANFHRKLHYELKQKKTD